MFDFGLSYAHNAMRISQAYNINKLLFSLFLPANLDFAANCPRSQSKTMLSDVMTTWEDAPKWRPFWLEQCNVEKMSEFASRIFLTRPISAKRKKKHLLFSPAVR